MQKKCASFEANLFLPGQVIGSSSFSRPLKYPLNIHGNIHAEKSIKNTRMDIHGSWI